MNERPLVEQLADEKESPYHRYLRMFVGEESLRAFVRYELLTGLLGLEKALTFLDDKLLPSM